MRVSTTSQFDLTHCTSLYQYDGCDLLFQALEEIGGGLRDEVAPDRPMGLSLYLSKRQCEELRTGGRLDALRKVLDARGLYVVALNGGRFGGAHCHGLKEHLHEPDWRDDARAGYTLRLARILADLLPQGACGGVATIPLAARETDKPWAACTQNILNLVLELVRLHEQTGRTIYLELDAEPGGLLRDIEAVMCYHRDWLMSLGAPLLERELGLSSKQALEVLRRHVRISLDLGLLAATFGDLESTWRRLKLYDLPLGRLRLGTALEATIPGKREARARLMHDLAPFREPSLPHPVTTWYRGRVAGTFDDVPQALGKLSFETAERWRVRYPLPLDIDQVGALRTTWDQLRDGLAFLLREGASNGAPWPAEIDTRAWAMLPPTLRRPQQAALAAGYRRLRPLLG